MAAPVQLHFYEGHAPAYELHLFGHILIDAIIDDPPTRFLGLAPELGHTTKAAYCVIPGFWTTELNSSERRNIAVVALPRGVPCTTP